MQTSYDMDVSLMGERLTNHLEISSELWVTDGLPAGLMTFIQMQGLRIGVDSVDKLIDARPIKGFPLRQVTKHTGTYGHGRSTSWTMETSVTAVHESPIAASVFEAPAGYRKVDRPSVMQQSK